MKKLTTFIYLIGRDHLPLGLVEKAVQDAEKAGVEPKYSNEELSMYAKHVAERLTKEE